MGEEPETIHARSVEVKHESYVILLLVPSIVFVLLLAFYMKSIPRNNNQPANTILGEEKALVPISVGGAQIEVSVVDTPEAKRKGLGGRTEMGESEGMLFVFGAPGPYQIWMKGMVIPIDIIFIRDDKVVTIHENVQPQPDAASDRDYRLYVPTEPVNYAIETRAGFVQEKGIKVGDGVDLSGAIK